MLLSPDTFFHWKIPRTIIDIRPANSFIKGSLPAAISIPPEKFASHADFISALKTVNKKDQVHLLDLDGSLTIEILKEINLFGLAGGYKSFKLWRESVFSTGPPIGILGGKTGSGKTEGLKSLIKMKRQVIDLEKLAVHRGSVFGNLPGKPQPAYEFFQNKLLATWLSLNPGTPVWIEEKGPFLGKIGLPQTLYNKMLQAFIIELEVPFEKRLQHVTKEYNKTDRKIFADCIRKLEPRIGVSACHKALHYHSTGQIEKCFHLLLLYYDRAYEKRRELYQSDGILSIKPSMLKKDTAISNFENEILSFNKMKDPAAFAAGTPLM